MARRAEGLLLEQIKDILTRPYHRRIRWKGERMTRELLARGFVKQRGGEGYRKYFGESVSVHIVLTEHGAFYHVDNH
jgi:hypothetical protein